jgi:hypothetical protein
MIADNTGSGIEGVYYYYQGGQYWGHELSYCENRTKVMSSTFRHDGEREFTGGHRQLEMHFSGSHPSMAASRRAQSPHIK